jgi:hypothetical protein
VFDSRVDLNTQSLLILFEAGEFNDNHILARDQTLKGKLSLQVGDALKFSLAEPLSTERNHDARQNPALIRNIRDHPSPDTSALREPKGRTRAQQKQPDGDNYGYESEPDHVKIRSIGVSVLANSILLTFKEDESRFTAFFRMVQPTRPRLKRDERRPVPNLSIAGRRAGSPP